MFLFLFDFFINTVCTIIILWCVYSVFHPFVHTQMAVKESCFFQCFLLNTNFRHVGVFLPISSKTFHIYTISLKKCYNTETWRTSIACSWGTEPEAWGRRRSDPPPLRPARCRTAAGSRCPTGGSFWGCWRPSPQRGPLCWAGSRRRRRTSRLWSQPGTRKAWWRPRGSRNLQRWGGSII